jgi:hypothetical protein
MKIKIKEGLAEMANIGISTLAVVLQDLFGKGDQFADVEDAEKNQADLVIMPIMAYEPHRIYLKSKAIKNTFLNARYSVYSKQPEDKRQCGRFIREDRHISKEEFVQQLPQSIRDATFEKEGEDTVLDFILRLASAQSDRVKFFYNLANGVGYDIHCMAVTHEYGEEGNPYLVSTVYMSVEVGK